VLCFLQLFTFYFCYFILSFIPILSNTQWNDNALYTVELELSGTDLNMLHNNNARLQNHQNNTQKILGTVMKVLGTMSTWH
jgi:hypothetical protein